MEQLADRIVPARTVIPVADPNDMIYDHTHQMMYFPAHGQINRFDLQTQTLLTPWDVGSGLADGDMSPDDHYLYVAGYSRTDAGAVVYKIDVETGEVTDLVFDPDGGDEFGPISLDLAIASNGLGFLTMDNAGSSDTFLWQFDLETDTFVNRGEVLAGTTISRSDDRSLLVFENDTDSAGIVFTYDAATNQFSDQLWTGGFASYAISASRDGSLISYGKGGGAIHVYDRNLNLVVTLDDFGVEGASAFDPLRDILYAINPTTDEIVAINTTNWTPLFSLPFEQDAGFYGKLVVTGDGSHLFYTRGEDFIMEFDIPGAIGARVFDTTVDEGPTGTRSIDVTVTLSSASAQAVTVDYATSDGTAVAGSDYSTVTGTITFLPGETVHTISIPIIGDTASEHGKAFHVTLLNNHGAVITREVAQVVIRNDDLGQPEITGLQPVITFLENDVNAAAQIIDSDVTFSDLDLADLAGGKLVVSYVAGGDFFESLGILAQGTGPGEIDVSGGTVSYAGVPFGTVTGGSNGGTLQVDFTSPAATPAAIEALIERLAYRNLFGNPAASRDISLVVTDWTGVSSPAATVTIQIITQNDPPTLSPRGNQTVPEDTGVIANFLIDDDEVAPNSLTVTVDSSNQAIVPLADIIVERLGTNVGIAFRPVPNQIGQSTITVTLSDGVFSVSRTFTLTFTAVNDRPTMSDIADQTAFQGVPLPPLTLIVDDVDTPVANLTVSATSSNTALIPNSGIVITGTGANRSIQITPAPNQTGTTTITVLVRDGQLTAGQTFDVTVNPAPSAPTITPIENLSTDEDTATSALPFTIGDVDSPLGDLTVTVSSSDQTLVPDANLILEGSGAGRTLTVTPQANQSGNVTVTLTVSDGTSTTQESFVLTVNPVDDAPTISRVENQSITEDSSTGLLAFTIDDIDTSVGTLIVTATSSDTTLVPLSGILLAGSGTSRTVQLTPALNQSGTATMTLTVSDGSSTSTSVFDLTVTPVNDAPTLSHIADLSINEDTTTGAVAFTIGDVDSSLGTLSLTAHSSDQSLVPDANLVLAGTGSSRTVTISPAANKSGSVTITLSVSDGTLVTPDSFTLTIIPIDDAPTLGTINGQTITEDTSSLVGFTIDDIDTLVGNLVVTASSSNVGLVPNGNVVLAGSGANRSVTVTPNTNASGTTTITISVSDGTTTTVGSFLLTVTPMNDPPTVSDILDQTTNEDQSTVAIPFTIGDLETLPANLSVTVTSSNAVLVPVGNIVLGGSNANRSLILTPQSNQSGTTLITVTVSDGNLSASDTFTLTVNPINDPPTISSIPNQQINEDASTPALNFSVGDLESTPASLVISATSSNLLLIPNANLVLGGSGVARTITATPLGNQSGTAIITISVTDGQLTTSTQFTVTVSPVNDAPTISDVVDLSIDEDSSTSEIAVTLSDIDTSAGNLILTATSSNLALVPNGNLVIGGSGIARTLVVTPSANLSGTTTITLTVSDGVATSTDTFVLTVDPVNDAPTIEPLDDLTLQEDTAAAPLVINIDDLDSPVNELLVTVTSSNTALVPNANLAVEGTGAARSLVISPVGNQSGTTTITISVTDGQLTTSTSFVLTVSDVNDSPTISELVLQTINEDQSTTALSFTIGDFETAATDLIVTASSSIPSLVADTGLVLGGSGTNRTLIVTPVANHSGLAVITVTVSDGSRWASTSFAVVVNPVNDAPSFTAGSDQTVLEDTPSVTVPGWATNLSTGPTDEAAQTLTFLVTTDHPELFSSGPAISINGDLTYTVAPDANGQAVVTVTLQDDGGTANGGADSSASVTFTITITPVEDTVEFPPEPPPQNYSSGGQPVSIDPQLSLQNPDAPEIDVSNGALKVSGGSKTDLLSLPISKKKKPANSEVSKIGDKVFYHDKQIGTVEGGKKGQPLHIKLGNDVKKEEINALLKAINFMTKGKKSADSTRTLVIELQDAANEVVAEASRTIHIVAD